MNGETVKKAVQYICPFTKDAWSQVLISSSQHSVLRG